VEDKQKFQGAPTEFPQQSEIAGIVAAAAPFVCSFSTSSSVNGVTVSQTDFLAIGLGAIAVLIGLSTIRLWATTAPEDLMKRRAMTVAIIGLGAFQLARGLGLFI